MRLYGQSRDVHNNVNLAICSLPSHATTRLIQIMHSPNPGNKRKTAVFKYLDLMNNYYIHTTQRRLNRGTKIEHNGGY